MVYALKRTLTIFRPRKKSVRRRRRQKRLRLRLERQNVERLQWVLLRARVKLLVRENEPLFLNSFAYEDGLTQRKILLGLEVCEI